ncbi:protein ABHD15-like [Amblyomma americanum]
MTETGPMAEAIQLLLLSPLSTFSVLVWLAALVLHVLSPRLEPRGSRPRLVARESDFSRFLSTAIPALTQAYAPPPWARHPTVQSLLAATVLRRSTDVPFFRTHLQLRDRGLVALDWAGSTPSAQPANPDELLLIVLVLPDLGRDPCSVGDTCRAILARGMRPVVLTQRGHAGCPLTTPRLQAYGDPGDLRQAVRFLRAHYGRCRVAVLGFGTGADLLLAYLGDTGSSSGLLAAVAVSPLYEPEKLLEQSPWPIGVLRRRALQRVVSEHCGVLCRAEVSPVDVDGALSASSWQDVEQKVLWPACGATSAAQYWERNAPLRDADDMATPLLCVSSADDPAVPEWALPMDIFQSDPQLLLLLTEHGGHCGFVAGLGCSSPTVPRSWADGVALDFIAATLDFTTRDGPLRKCATR